MAAAPEDAPGILRTGPIEAALQGGHLIAARTTAGDPLFLSRKAVFASGQAIRGGVPVIFPWFGDGPQGGRLGAHGFARTVPWRELERGAAGESLVLELVDSETTRALWPHAFRLRLGIRVGAELGLELEVENCGTEPFEYETALHSYFEVAAVAQTWVHGLEHARYLDKTADFAERCQGPEPLRFEGEVDRIYPANGAAVRIEDRAGGRAITVETTGNRSTIVWNPGARRARKLRDLGDDWKRFVCVESGNVGPDGRTLAPGQVDRSGVRIAIDRSG